MHWRSRPGFRLEPPLLPRARLPQVPSAQLTRSFPNPTVCSTTVEWAARTEGASEAASEIYLHRWQPLLSLHPLPCPSWKMLYFRCAVEDTTYWKLTASPMPLQRFDPGMASEQIENSRCSHEATGHPAVRCRPQSVRQRQATSVRDTSRYSCLLGNYLQITLSLRDVLSQPCSCSLKSRAGRSKPLQLRLVIWIVDGSL